MKGCRRPSQVNRRSPEWHGRAILFHVHAFDDAVVPMLANNSRMLSLGFYYDGLASSRPSRLGAVLNGR